MARPVPAWTGLALAALCLGSCKADIAPIGRHRQTPGVATCSDRGGACRVPGLFGSGCLPDEDLHHYAVKCDSGCGYWRGRCGQSCCVPRAQTPGVATCKEMGGTCRVPGVLSSRCRDGETWREFDIKCDSGCGYWMGMCGQSCCLPASAGDGLAGSGGAGNLSSSTNVSNVSESAGAATSASAGPSDTSSASRPTGRPGASSMVEPDLEPQAAFKVDDMFSTSTDITASNNTSLGVVDFACLFGVVILVATIYRCSRPQPSDHSPLCSDVE